MAIWVIETLVNKQGNLTPLRLISISMSRPGGIIQFSSFANVRGKHGDRAGSITRGGGVCAGDRGLAIPIPGFPQP